MGEVRGIEVRGAEADHLLLSDGTELVLEADGATPEPWHRHGDGLHETVSIAGACHLAGDDFAGYVRTRTFAEAQWLSMLGAWANERSAMLVSEGELALRA